MTFQVTNICSLLLSSTQRALVQVQLQAPICSLAGFCHDSGIKPQSKALDDPDPQRQQAACQICYSGINGQLHLLNLNIQHKKIFNLMAKGQSVLAEVHLQPVG